MTSKIESAMFGAAAKLEKHFEGKDNESKADSGNAQTNGASAEGGGSSSEATATTSDSSKGAGAKEHEGPPGGYDDTPVPRAPPGYTLKFTFHFATNLPMADIASLSSDPYIIAQLTTGLPMRHKEDPPLMLRTPTIRRSTEPVWNSEWVVANVPASGFKLKCRIYDEDPADHDDRLGNATIVVQGINAEWPGIHEQSYKIKKRMGSKRAYLMRGLAVALHKTKHMDGSLLVSVENMGKTQDENGGRAYTVGPMWFTKHYSPMLGRIANRKEPTDEDSRSRRRKAERYNFQANQFQMPGPVPPELYHRFVEFKPFVKRMFKASGVEGYLLSKALHHQHARVYNFDRTTEFGYFNNGPSHETTMKFLELVHYDKGGRIFTYVLTLDGLFRFTETGKEFGIDFLSKHTMHSDVNIYIAYSGEFFIRRLRHKNRPTPEEHLHGGVEDRPQSPGEQSHRSRHSHNRSMSSTSSPTSHHRQRSSGSSPLPPQSPGDQTEEHPPGPVSGGPPNDDPPQDPRYYELVIDNDSGTYRPNADLLPILRKYLQHTLPGLHIAVLDCQADAELQQKMKKEQRERKRQEGQRIIYRQANDSDTSISSSDISDLSDVEHEFDRAEGGGADATTGNSTLGKVHSHEKGVWKQFGKDARRKGEARGQKWKIIAKGRDHMGRPEVVVDADGVEHRVGRDGVKKVEKQKEKDNVDGGGNVSNGIEKMEETKPSS